MCVCVRLHRCWWRMLETKCVGDKFEMLVTDSGCWWPIKYIKKITNITKKVANIMILPPTSEISHHHKVTNITMSPTSLSPFCIFHLVNLWKDNCEAEHEECEWDEGECFKELRDDRLPINPKENPEYAGRQLDDSPKLCYDEYNNNYVDHPELRSRRAVGARPESYIWPWMYRLNGKNSEGEFFCTANQIGRNLLVTGKI